MKEMPVGKVDPEVRQMIETVAKHLPEFNDLVGSLDYLNLPKNRYVDMGFPGKVDTIYQFVNDNFFVQTHYERIGQFQRPPWNDRQV